MLKAVFRILRFILLIFGGHKEIALENAALRQQLAILKRDRPRPTLHRRDRLFWVLLMKMWRKWKSALVIVQPATVVNWQRRRFKLYWWKLWVANSRKSRGDGRLIGTATVRLPSVCSKG